MREAKKKNTVYTCIFHVISSTAPVDANTRAKEKKLAMLAASSPAIMGNIDFVYTNNNEASVLVLAQDCKIPTGNNLENPSRNRKFTNNCELHIMVA